MSLIFGKPQDEFIVERVLTGLDATLRLKEMGIIPGVKIKLISNSGGPLVVGIGNMRLAIGRGLASKIIVRKI